MPRGRRPIGERALTSTERVHAARRNRPRTEELHRALARVLVRAVREGWIALEPALDEVMIELEQIEVGPEKRHLTESEREAIARKLLEGRSR